MVSVRKIMFFSGKGFDRLPLAVWGEEWIEAKESFRHVRASN